MSDNEENNGVNWCAIGWSCCVLSTIVVIILIILIFKFKKRLNSIDKDAFKVITDDIANSAKNKTKEAFNQAKETGKQFVDSVSEKIENLKTKKEISQFYGGDKMTSKEFFKHLTNNEYY